MDVITHPYKPPTSAAVWLNTIIDYMNNVSADIFQIC